MYRYRLPGITVSTRLLLTPFRLVLLLGAIAIGWFVWQSFYGTTPIRSRERTIVESVLDEKPIVRQPSPITIRCRRRSIPLRKVKRKKMTQRTREAVLQRYGYRCASCCISIDSATCDIDHVIALSAGRFYEFPFDLESEQNLRPLCPNCHRLHTIWQRQQGLFARV
jgi:5-methylcytosine-specific restriction endonuclease McrA